MTKKDYELLKERHEKAINRYFNLLQQFNPYTVKAKYVTCRKCGSRFNTSMMLKQPLSTSAPYKCPVCKNSEGLYSQTANKRIKQAYENKNSLCIYFSNHSEAVEFGKKTTAVSLVKTGY